MPNYPYVASPHPARCITHTYLLSLSQLATTSLFVLATA
jgi:hypothetical protein